MENYVAISELRERLIRIYTGFVEAEKESIEQMDSSGDPDGSLRLRVAHSQGAQQALKTLADQLDVELMDRGSPGLDQT